MTQSRFPDLPSLQLNVNVSARQIDADFSARVNETLNTAGIAPTQLLLELTVSVIVDDATPVAQLHELRETGVRIALEDFGTAYRTLRYPTQLPVDMLKLDRGLSPTSMLPRTGLLLPCGLAPRPSIRAGRRGGGRRNSRTGATPDTAGLFGRPETGEAFAARLAGGGIKTFIFEAAVSDSS